MPMKLHGYIVVYTEAFTHKVYKVLGIGNYATLAEAEAVILKVKKSRGE